MTLRRTFWRKKATRSCQHSRQLFGRGSHLLFPAGFLHAPLKNRKVCHENQRDDHHDEHSKNSEPYKLWTLLAQVCMSPIFSILSIFPGSATKTNPGQAERSCRLLLLREQWPP